MSIQDDKENVNTFSEKIKKFSRPPERAGDRGASVLVAEVFPVAMLFQLLLLPPKASNH